MFPTQNSKIGGANQRNMAILGIKTYTKKQLPTTKRGNYEKVNGFIELNSCSEFKWRLETHKFQNTSFSYLEQIVRRPHLMVLKIKCHNAIKINKLTSTHLNELEFVNCA